jgi:hypothetical protein
MWQLLFRKIDLYRLVGNVFLEKRICSKIFHLKKSVSPFDGLSPKKTTHANQCSSM